MAPLPLSSHREICHTPVGSLGLRVWGSRAPKGFETQVPQNPSQGKTCKEPMGTIQRVNSA